MEAPLIRARSADCTPSSSHVVKTSPLRTRTSSEKGSCLGAFRWVLLGIIIGCTATAFLQYSINLPSLCINLTYEQGGGGDDLHPLAQMEQERIHKKLKKKKKKKHLEIISNATDTGAAEIGAETATKQEEEPPPHQESNPDPPFINLPPPPSLTPTESFSACLLIKDDNHWLIEWLAYHYFVMPLRHLIVVIDPESKTSPLKILDRWKSRGLMDIRIWKDEDFMPKTITAKAHMFDNNTGLMMHRVRQNNFFRRCIPTLRNRKRDWVMLVDTDEYVLPSYASGHFRNLTSKVPFEEGGSVLRLLKYYEQVEPSVAANHTCVYMPRFFYGAKESRPELVQHGAPKSIDAAQMVTQRYLWREPRRNFNGKNLLHTARVPNLKTFGSVHNVAEACPDPNYVRSLNQNKHALVRVHHYLGTPEQYLFRDDPRVKPNTQQKQGGLYENRGMKRYNENNRKGNHEDHAAKAWIRGFVREMGEEVAANLLKGVGQVGIE